MLALAWAPTCAACAAPLDEPTAGVVCSACWRRVERFTPPVCHACGAPISPIGQLNHPADRCHSCQDWIGRLPDVVACRAVGPYAGNLRAIVHAFKYQGRRSLAYPLAALMRWAGTDILRGADCVVPVPLHRARLFRRGFNQAAELAVHLGLPLVAALRRTRPTPPQTTLPATRREPNVRGAFSLASPHLVARRVEGRIRARRIVLVDDVVTTGATLAACAAVLRGAGATDVRALTIARAAGRSRR